MALPIGGATAEARAANDRIRQQIEQNSLHVALQSARSAVIDVIGTIAENFKSVLLPPLHTFGDTLRGISSQLGPDGNQFAQFALYGGGLAGALLLLRAVGRSMGGIGRMALGGGLGFSLGGLEMGILSAMAMRSMGGGGAGIGAALGAGAAGAAAAAAGMTIGQRMMAGMRTAFGFAGRFLRSSILIGVAVELIRNWEAVAERLDNGHHSVLPTRIPR